MAETEIRLEIVTPDSTVYSEVVDHVVVPTANGRIDLYQNQRNQHSQAYFFENYLQAKDYQKHLFLVLFYKLF